MAACNDALNKVLVYWINEVGRWSLVSETAVKSNCTVGKNNQAKWGGRYFPVLVIAKGPNKIMKEEGGRFETLLNTLLLEECDEAIILNRIKKEYCSLNDKSSTDKKPEAPDDKAAKLESDSSLTTPSIVGGSTDFTPRVPEEKAAKLSDDTNLSRSGGTHEDDLHVFNTRSSKFSCVKTVVDKTETKATESPLTKPRSSSSYTSSKSEISELKDDIAYLKSEVRRLKRKVNKLDPERVETEREYSKIQKTTTTETDKKESDKTVDLDSLITGNKSLVQSIQIIVNALFTKEQLKTCSITGKKSPKSDGNGRPALDQAKVTQVLNAILKTFPGTEKKVVVEKIQNMQKVLRRH